MMKKAGKREVSLYDCLDLLHLRVKTLVFSHLTSPLQNRDSVESGGIIQNPTLRSNCRDKILLILDDIAAIATC